MFCLAIHQAPAASSCKSSMPVIWNCQGAISLLWLNDTTI
nr:MAG TPA: hypothetical protein [Bacteriophage sp.]